MSAKERRDVWLGVLFLGVSLGFLAAFRAGNRSGFEVPLAVRAAYLAVACGFGAYHGLRTQTGSRLARFVVAVFVVSAAAELIGVRTGLLFGSYHYTDRLGPLLPGGLPLAIPIFWVLMLYAADDLASLALPEGSPRWVSLSATAAAVAAWDLMVDPIAVEYGCWVWHDGGPVFGVPAWNAPSWFGVALVALVAGGAPLNPTARTIQRADLPVLAFRHLPALGLVAAAANNVVATFELGFPSAGLVAGAALAPYAVLATARVGGALVRGDPPRPAA